MATMIRHAVLGGLIACVALGACGTPTARPSGGPPDGAAPGALSAMIDRS